MKNPRTIRELVNMWKDWRAGQRRKTATAKEWRQAVLLSDLGHLTARWLEGELAFHPGGYDVPADETLHLVPVLGAFDPQAPYRAVSPLPYEVSAKGLADWQWWAA